VAERSKALAWKASNIQKVFQGSNPCLSANCLTMAVRIGSFATTSCKPRQARKGAAVAAMSGAEVRLVRAASLIFGEPGLSSS
jgi:hypothetical protein